MARICLEHACQAFALIIRFKLTRCSLGTCKPIRLLKVTRFRILVDYSTEYWLDFLNIQNKKVFFFFNLLDIVLINHKKIVLIINIRGIIKSKQIFNCYVALFAMLKLYFLDRLYFSVNVDFGRPSPYQSVLRFPEISASRSVKFH